MKNSKSNKNVILIVVAVVIGVFALLFSKKNTENNDVITNNDPPVPDLGEEAAVASVRIDNLSWKEWVNNIFVSRNTGQKASQAIGVQLDNIMKNSQWKDNLKEQSTWESIPYPEYLIRASIQQALKQCVIKPKNPSDKGTIIIKSASIGDMLDSANCHDKYPSFIPDYN